MSGIRFFLDALLFDDVIKCAFSKICVMYMLCDIDTFIRVYHGKCAFSKSCQMYTSCDIDTFIRVYHGSYLFGSEMSYFDTFCVLKKVSNNTVILVLFTNEYYGLNNGTDMRYVFFEKLYGFFPSVFCESC